MTTQGNLSPTSVTYRGLPQTHQPVSSVFYNYGRGAGLGRGLGVAPGLTVVSLPIQIRAISVVRWLELLSEKFVFIRIHWWLRGIRGFPE